MAVKNENYSFLKNWSDIYVDEYERTSSVMSDYHAHDYYEVSLILSGDVRVLIPGASSESSSPRAVLCAPGVPHYITCTEGTKYKRINVVFSEEFIASSKESESVTDVFKKSGNVISVEEKTANELLYVARMLMGEKNRFRQRLLLLYYLSRLSECDSTAEKRVLPPYVSETLAYVKENYSEKLIAAELAERVSVGRTTLMTGFKKYTGMSLCEYILRCRMTVAVELLSNGVSERVCAERCGFGESSGLIRAFKKHFGMTPRRYIAVSQGAKKQLT